MPPGLKAKAGAAHIPGARVPAVVFGRLREGPAPTPREVTANFEVQPSPDGSAIVWSLQFKTREAYHAVLETTADGADRAKIREMIAAGLKLHHIAGCSAQEKVVTKLGSEGIAFIGSCSVDAHAVPAGGI
jgi:hypothetical protein